MNKIDELITELCPNGVPFKKVKEVYTRLKGTPITAGKMKEIACDDGEIRVFAGGKTVINAHEKDIPKANITRVPAVLVQSRGVIDVVYYEKPFTFKNEMWAYTSDNDIRVKYLYYIFKNNIQRFRDAASGMGSLPQISLVVTEEFKLPVPPLEVQREIVRILDNFTELTTELTTELEARKKQYEYYRDLLLNFDRFGGVIRKVKLRDIATDIYRGSGITREQVTEGGVPCVRYGEIYTTYNIWFDECKSHTKIENIRNPKYFEHGDILFAITGESVEDIAKSTAYVGNDRCLAGGDIVVLKHNQNPKYLSYVLSTHNAQQQKSKGKIKSKVVHSSVPAIEEIEIPLPELEVQNRLVNVLDNFDAICTDLNIGLPAEIEARQKQYEYYRDLLLTFVESGNTILPDRQTDRQTDRQSVIKLLQYVFGYVMLPLDEIANLFRGEYITKNSTHEGTVPVILGGQEPAYYIDKFNHEGEIVVVARSGASAGFVSYWNEPIFVTDGFGYEEKTGLIITKYLYYILKNMESALNMMKRGAGVPHISGETLAKIMIPVPQISEQERIVRILDRFDTLCNDIAEGLPAEIEARRKQYEYYRDKLLAFKKL